MNKNRLGSKMKKLRYVATFAESSEKDVRSTDHTVCFVIISFEFLI